MSKRVTLLLIAVLTVSNLIGALSEMANCDGAKRIVLPRFPSQIKTERFTYELPNYNVSYAIDTIPDTDYYGVTTYVYNIHVYGPPPFPIQIEFYQQNKNVTEKRTSIMQTNVYSTSIYCTSYPTQITMMRVENESVSPTPSPSTEPTSPSSQEPLLTSEQKEITVVLTIAALVLGLGMVAVFLFKQPSESSEKMPNSKADPAF